ncbi:MAG: GNAT family N-acetyltransferase [Isosphaeraceae bacterium]
MSDSIPLTPCLIQLDSPEFKEILEWTFADSYVSRLLQNDIPNRMQFGKGRTWIYRDPHGRIAGFGIIDVCEEYSEYTAGMPHPYIPLLAVNSEMGGRGHGKSIVLHLIDEAVRLAHIEQICSDVLFLDVYVDNFVAIRLYAKAGFANVKQEPIPDPSEGNKPFFIMARRVPGTRI